MFLYNNMAGCEVSLLLFIANSAKINAALGYINYPRIFHETLARRPKGKPILFFPKSINDNSRQLTGNYFPRGSGAATNLV